MIIRNIEHFSEIDSTLREDDLYDDYEEFIANPTLGDDKILISGPLFRLCGTSLIVVEGTYYYFDEDSGTMEPDFGVSLLYESFDEPDLDAPLYWEQGTPASMFHNYIRVRGLDQEGITETMLYNECVA